MKPCGSGYFLFGGDFAPFFVTPFAVIFLSSTEVINFRSILMRLEPVLRISHSLLLSWWNA
jgi:hypothetical protein